MSGAMTTSNIASCVSLKKKVVSACTLLAMLRKYKIFFMQPILYLS